jgi:transposase InsO family protein
VPASDLGVMRRSGVSFRRFADVARPLARHGKPEIFNTDQGSQFTGTTFTGVLIKNAIAISMDGKGAWRDNVFVERLWRSVKYEEVYLRAYDSVSEARASIGYFRKKHSKCNHCSAILHHASFSCAALPPRRGLTSLIGT